MKTLAHLIGKSIATVSLVAVMAIIPLKIMAYSDDPGDTYPLETSREAELNSLEGIFEKDLLNESRLTDPDLDWNQPKESNEQVEEISFGDPESPETIVDDYNGNKPISTPENPLEKDWVQIAVVVASAGAVGIFANSIIKKGKENKNTFSESSLTDLKSSITPKGDPIIEDFEDLDKSVDEVIPEQKGIWISKDSRLEILSEINQISSIQYKVDEFGFLTIDTSQPMDETKSFKASKLIDRVMKEANKTIIGVDETFYRPNIKDESIQEVELQGGIKIGNQDTDSVVIINENDIAGIHIIHELGHVLEDFDSDVKAIEIENEIRRELGFEERNSKELVNENRDLLYNNLNAGEGYLEDFAKEIDATVIKDQFSDAVYVQAENEDGLTVGYFNPDLNGTYLEPGTENLVVREKEFRFRMDLDLKEGEVYLRTFVESRGGNIEWFEEEGKAVITYGGNTYEIYPLEGEFDSYIVNDRIAIQENMARELMELEVSETYVTDTSTQTESETYDGYSDYEYSEAYNQLEVEMVEEESQTVDLEDFTDDVIKEFRFRLNLDIEEQEVYLRSYIEDMNGEIIWDEVESKALVNLEGNTISIEPGEYDSRIVNDRLVLEKDVLDGLLDIKGETPDIDFNIDSTLEGGNLSTQNLEDYDFGSNYTKYIGASTIGGGLIFHKYKKDIIASLKDESYEDSIEGFIQGIKEGIRDLGFEAKDLLDNNFVHNELNETGKFLARAAWVENGSERKLLLNIVKRDLDYLEKSEPLEDVFLKAKNFSKTIVPCLLASAVIGGIGAGLHTVEKVLEKEDHINQKMFFLKKHTDILLNLQEYLRSNPNEIYEVIFQTQEKLDEYILNLWEWDIPVMVKKGILNPKQDAILYKLTLID